ncbi:MAG: hypothetical protein P1P61_06335 [Treponemataceae bacterium]
MIKIAFFSSQACIILRHTKYERAMELPRQCVYGTLLWNGES